MRYVYLAHVNREVDDTKDIGLKSWIEEGVYAETNDVGEEAFSVRQVVTPKLIDGKASTKARLVSQGFEEDTAYLRLIFELAASMNWPLKSIDIKAVVFYGNLIQTELYLRQPEEVKRSGKVWRLKKVVYGLPDASRVWCMRV